MLAVQRFFKLVVSDNPSHFCAKLLEVKAVRSGIALPIAEASSSQLQLLGIFCDKVMKVKNLPERLSKLMQESVP